jgi:hypothetical protein
MWHPLMDIAAATPSLISDDIIEAIECLKSWAQEEVIYGVGSDVRKVENMLRDLEQRALEM